MAKILSQQMCYILPALITFHGILSTEGKQLKPTNKKETSSVKASATEGKKKIFPPVGYADSATAYKDDFRPTTPGNNPGVGHSFARNNEDVESKVMAVYSVSTAGAGHSVTVFKDDFRPMAPGHSPGVGHALKKANEEPKVLTCT